ncbi:MAG: hypothetical protein JST80_12395 [Bdellovibrionales bacterium]|nr:hypothetical protein [Bdellovibrionales bacterium]
MNTFKPLVGILFAAVSLNASAFASTPKVFDAKFHYFELLPKYVVNLKFKAPKRDCEKGSLPKIRLQLWTAQETLKGENKKPYTYTDASAIVMSDCVPSNQYANGALSQVVENTGRRMMHVSMTLVDNIEIEDEEMTELPAKK